MRFAAFALLVLLSLPASAQAPFLGPDQTGFVMGLGLGRITNGEDVSLASVEGVATVGPRVDLTASVGAAVPDAERTVWATGLSGTAYLVAGPTVWAGPTAGLSVANVFSDRDNEVVGSVGVVGSGRVPAGPVEVVLQGSAVISGQPFEDRADPFLTLGAGASAQFTSGRGVVIAVGPTVSRAFIDDEPGGGLTSVGGTLRFVRVP